ncbi:tRNA nuclease WapA [Clostridium pasteurianum DSM 525 = ATCC 6013]|uniref:RHS repeat-associated core domain containing protein-containing protein n=1 Tax=Clostridium pasteurianum DSM 525 = ATCC 6013 TaxID=1262449 RepID=A0A0H3J7B0_CLOPA|nr:RHS repeat-associated core domain-containing protein [Clostridium pasteurianum]AJA46865.1 tRNA nuclease WapA [Clostridium pasteurianum DSM 525 = ATCC 6013]AJA50853.1 tRNA nuclease WapA [Clostridium pasteurianum DSM 525 = ATCC 6013]AOZ74251.1 hypothetical protein AQ983_03685 [Clostridium pasteurianum DSM 525 = ATCC 6013]AOZ78049.1 hypothetical protein AQ984_03685 [Clostridium pasteurianum]ELP58523.1 hypothetical protein F502_13615 [Clostridium pasteurianum DSM 525 = ATCC 6013]
MNLNGTEYYYIRNAQGDIIGLFDKAGTQVVAYTYDTWGKLISTTGTLASTVGAKNPYRYRGYRYDGETGLYYLQTRYYNAELGRFINADSYIGTPGELLSCNMFAYCGNNPVNRDDPNGEFWGLLAAAFVISPLAAVAVTVILAVAVDLIVVAVVSVAVATYRNSHISYSDSSSSSSSSRGNKTIKSNSNTANSVSQQKGVQNKSKPTGGKRSKNKLKPDSRAEGPHTTFKRSPDTGKVTNYETWKPNPKNPTTGFESEKRYDGIGEPHFNKVTKERMLPHVHDKTAPGDIRKPIPWEIPK